MLYTLLIVLAVTLPMCWYQYRKMVQHGEESRQTLTAADKAGMTEPPTLHPVIDPALCGGCGTCVEACPEGKVLGLIEGKAQLIQPTKCIGHGACREVCPLGAITPVFGTARRGTPRKLDVPGEEQSKVVYRLIDPAQYRSAGGILPTGFLKSIGIEIKTDHGD